MERITIDFNKVTGMIKPMHAVNNPPTVPFDAYGLYGKMREANIPYVRLHDTGGAFGGARYVDVENIFPDFSADEKDPASYDFAFTDALLSSLAKAGLKPFYRLGCTIENNHKLKAYHIFPPADPHKWARVCERIIMHYNEGWADGYHYGIEYWEIWNEPDNEPEITENPMWRGTQEEFFLLYDITAKHLKERFPRLKIGGYASCGFYAVTAADYSETAGSTPRVEYFLDFFHNFLKYVKANGSPLDFFSWHSYAGVSENVKYAAYARENLELYGCGGAEVIFNEWNPGVKNRGTAADASYIAAMMCAMQKTSTDMCMYYDGQINSPYCGLFSGDRQSVFKAYYAFRAFGELYSQKNEAFSETSGGGLYVCAASGDKNLALLANTNSSEIKTEIVAPAITGCSATDQSHEYEEITVETAGGVITLPPHAVWLLAFA